MSDRKDDLESARTRIRAAYSPELFATLADRWTETLTAHFRSVTAGDGPVLNWQPPPQAIAAAAELLDDCPKSATAGPEVAVRFGELFQSILSKGQNLHHPRYIGHQVPASIPIAALFDAVGAATNQVMAIYEMGPWATAVERVMIHRVGEMLGLAAGTFAGLITNGGSLANLTALLTARNVALGKSWTDGVRTAGPAPVLVAHADVHYSVTRAAGILGLGTSNVLRAVIDVRRRMVAPRLDAQLHELRRESRPVVAVVACACGTPIGAFDPLDEISAVCREHGVWLHVDAAHGGAAACSERHRQLVAGIEQADSIVVDAHKMLFMPALCALVFYKDSAHRFEAFRQDAPYLFDPSAPGMAEYDSGMLTVECTKRASAFGLWGVWSLFGPQLFADLVDSTFDLGTRFYQMLDVAPDFEPLHVPQCNIVTFRYRPEPLRHADAKSVGELNQRIRRQIIESGAFYLVQTNLDGAGALRVTIINPLTTEADLQALLEEIRRVGNQLSAQDR